jgi:hypothetical protein
VSILQVVADRHHVTVRSPVQRKRLWMPDRVTLTPRCNSFACSLFTWSRPIVFAYQLCQPGNTSSTVKYFIWLPSQRFLGPSYAFPVAMMAAQDLQPTRWVVLIGIGLTVGDPRRLPVGSDQDRSLKGAVPDVITMNEYLRTEPYKVNTTMLTATKVQDGGAPRPVETRECLPTNDNVTSSFNRILDRARSEDYVYIHYSGHGTRRNFDGAVAIELVNPTTFMPEYLYGTTLRNAIKAMISRGLRVTLVLDCCFSGGALRTRQTNVRYLEHDPEIDMQSDYSDPWAKGLPGELRNGVVNLERLLDPEGYTILAACGDGEVASELKFEGGASRGALSYFLVDSLTLLRRRGAMVSSQTLHQHIRAQFHASLLEQTPMLYGNQGFSFFGVLTRHAELSIVDVYRTRADGHLTLSAGQAHGVHQGDEYALSPFETRENINVMVSAAVRGKVDSVGCLDSRLAIVDPRDLEKIAKGAAWKAVLVTSLSSRKIRISLGPDVPDRNELIHASSSYNFLVLSGNTEASDMGNSVFHVVMNAQHAYEIRDLTSKKIHNLAAMAQDKNGSRAKLLNVLHHVAKYKYFEGINNQFPSPSFENSFRLSTEANPAEDGHYNVKHQEKLTLLFENLAEHPLYLAIFIFTQLWEVRNLASESGEDTYLPVEPRGGRNVGSLELPLTMWVPKELQDEGNRWTEDTIKILVTRQPSTFPGRVLLPLSHDSQRGGEPDPLSTILQVLRGDSSRDGANGPFEWTTRIFLIRTHSENSV